MRQLHLSAQIISNGQYQDIFALNDAPSTTFADLKAVLAHAIEYIELSGESLVEREAKDLQFLEANLSDPQDAWILARMYGSRHTLRASTLALALLHAGRMGYARVSRDGGEARNANVLLASQLYVWLTLQLSWGGQARSIQPYLGEYARILPEAWMERLDTTAKNQKAQNAHLAVPA